MLNLLNYKLMDPRKYFYQGSANVGGQPIVGIKVQ